MIYLANVSEEGGKILKGGGVFQNRIWHFTGSKHHVYRCLVPLAVIFFSLTRVLHSIIIPRKLAANVHSYLFCSSFAPFLTMIDFFFSRALKYSIGSTKYLQNVLFIRHPPKVLLLYIQLTQAEDRAVYFRFRRAAWLYMKCVNIRVLVYIEMHIAFVGVHTSSRRITLSFRDNTYSGLPGWVPVLFQGAPAKISAVNTCMKLVKPWKFIDRLSADAARLSKSSVCAHKHRLFWRHTNAYRDRARTHTVNMRWGRIYLSLTFSLSVSFSLSALSGPLAPSFIRGCFRFRCFSNT